jgi:hypothetical protein
MSIQNTLLRFSLAIKLMALITFPFFGLTSCKEDEDDIVIAEPVVQFFASTQIFSEDDGEQLIKITLDQPSPIGGMIKVSVADTERFTTVPAAENGTLILAVVKNQHDIEFKIIPSDNAKTDGDEKIDLTITEVSKGFILGTTKVSEITVEDDEVPVQANFLFGIAPVRENKVEGFEAIIFFNGFTKSAGSITVAFQSSSAVYGTDFITEPAAVNGKLQLPVEDQSDYVFLKFIPVNDELITGDMPIKFTLESAQGGIAIGESNIMNLTLVDDESFPLFKVSDVRSLYTGESTILENMNVVGVVTSVKDNMGQTTTYIEDETGGIAIRFIIANNFQRGDKLNINLGYGLLKETQGVLEIQQVSEAEKIGEAVPSYTIITLEELSMSEEDLEGKLVVLHELGFTEADGINTMQGDRIISNGTYTAIVRTLNHASFKDQLVPPGDMVVRGILTESDGTYIIYPQIFSEDVVLNSEYEWLE